MSSSLRRFEVLLPLRFNDGREVPPEWMAEAVLEVVDRFGAASYETQKVEGHWRHGGVTYRDDLVRRSVRGLRGVCWQPAENAGNRSDSAWDPPTISLNQRRGGRSGHLTKLHRDNGFHQSNRVPIVVERKP